MSVRLAVPVGLSLGVFLCAAAQGDKPTSIKDVMVQAHKGKNSLVSKVMAGKGSPEEHSHLLELYQFMATQKPPQGDDTSWKDKTSALVTASMHLVDKKDGAADEFKKAVNCKACHSLHKPKK